MSVNFTDGARAALVRADAAARRLNADARVRLALAGGTLVSTLTDAPEDDDVTLEVDGAQVFLAAGIDGLIDVGEHDRLLLR